VYESNSKILFLADILFLGGCLRFGKYILTWQAFFLWGSYWIGVTMYSSKYGMCCIFSLLGGSGNPSSLVQQCPCISWTCFFCIFVGLFCSSPSRCFLLSCIKFYSVSISSFSLLGN